MLVIGVKYNYVTTIQLSEFERVYLIIVISHENNHSLLGIWSLYFDGFEIFPLDKIISDGLGVCIQTGCLNANKCFIVGSV